MTTPNLKRERVRYQSAKECSDKRHIPYELLIKSKQYDPPGIRSNNSIVWNEYQPWLKSHYDLLLEKCSERIKLNKRKLNAQVIKAETYNKAKSQDCVSRAEVLDFIGKLNTALEAKLLAVLDKQSADCAGMAALDMKKYNKTLISSLYADLRQNDPLGLSGTG